MYPAPITYTDIMMGNAMRCPFCNGSRVIGSRTVWTYLDKKPCPECRGLGAITKNGHT